MKPKAQMAALLAVGAALQLVGVWWCLRPGWEEVNLLVGVLLALFGTTVAVWGGERYVTARGRRDTWALMALAAPVAPFVLARLSPGEAADEQRVERPRTRADRAAGALLTLLVSVGFIGALAQWSAGYEWPRSDEPVSFQRHEQLAYQRLQSIATAQQRYVEKDWDGDGEKTFAAFLPHLWRSVDSAGHPIAVDLIPRELALAMSKRLALDGYLYTSIHHFVPTKRRPKPAEQSYPNFSVLDEALQWGVIAAPVQSGRTGVLGFVADSSGKIWTTHTGTQGDWIEVRSAEHLREIQRGTNYPEPSAPEASAAP